MKKLAFPALMMLMGALILPACVPGWSSAMAQDNSKQQKEMAQQAMIKKWIEAKRFQFVAQSATPSTGKSRQLTTEYTLNVMPDSLDCHLPYYGRAYSGGYGGGEGGITFKTTDFQYSAADAKKGGWNITIKPKNQSSAQQIFMSISASGYANVQVRSNSRDMISFYGSIQELK